MYLKNITDIYTFLKIVNECEGSVYLVSKTGSKFDLKSVFTKYMNFEKMFKDENINEIELNLSSSKDVQKFLNFMIEESRKSKKNL